MVCKNDYKIPQKAYLEQMESTTKAFEKLNANSADNIKNGDLWYKGIKGELLIVVTKVALVQE